MLGRIGNKFKNLKNLYRQNRILGLWESKKYEKMAKMLKNKDDYGQFKINEYSFIYFLINQKDKQAISTLLNKVQYKADIIDDEKNPMAINPISYAFLEGDDEIVEILQKNGGNLKKMNSEGQNILHLAAIYKRQQSFKKGVAKDLDINVPDTYGNTPFHYAARAGSPQMTSTMISAKAKRLENKINQYPVHMAIQSGSNQTLQLLKSDLIGTYPKYHPIHSAARSGNTAMVKTVLESKPASLNFKDLNQLTPLHHAVIVQDITMVNSLLSESGILIDETDSYGNTPLHLSLMNSNLQISTYLIQRKANLDILNEQNLSPADYGIMSQNKQIHSLLLKYQHRSKKIEEWTSLKY